MFQRGWNVRVKSYIYLNNVLIITISRHIRYGLAVLEIWTEKGCWINYEITNSASDKTKIKDWPKLYFILAPNLFNSRWCSSCTISFYIIKKEKLQPSSISWKGFHKTVIKVLPYSGFLEKYHKWQNSACYRSFWIKRNNSQFFSFSDVKEWMKRLRWREGKNK